MRPPKPTLTWPLPSVTAFSPSVMVSLSEFKNWLNLAEDSSKVDKVVFSWLAASNRGCAVVVDVSVLALLIIFKVGGVVLHLEI